MTTRMLFWFQVVMAWIYTGFQIAQLINGKTSGMTLALWLMFMVYLFLGLSLAILAWQEKKEKERFYTVVIFGQWSIFVTLLFLLSIGSVVWSSGDTAICIAALIFSIMTIKVYGLRNPMTRGWLAVWFKGLPQLWAAYVMYQADSAEWLHPITLIAAHATSVPRLVLVYRQGRKGGWDKATKALLLGEVANVGTWCVVTVVWLVLRVF
jgi:hypothetical protein